MTAILLVDDHVLFRAGLRSLLEARFQHKDLRVDEAGSGEEALIRAREHEPNLVIMDLNMPGIGGMEACRRLLQVKPDVKVLVVTAMIRGPYPRRLLEVGVHGYLSKFTPPEEFFQAITNILNGERSVGTDVARRLALEVTPHSDKPPIESVTPREMQVLLMLAKGANIQTVSDLLNLSPKTVSTYRYRLYQKLGCKNDVELTHAAIRHGVVEVQPE